MPIWLQRKWDELRTSFWFLPTLMSVAALLTALLTTNLDHRTQDQAWQKWDWAYSGSPEGARAVLSVIAGSMITVAGTVFSITTVALTLASAQFGPRLLRNFIRDRGNQFVLGAFTATFLFCLLVLRTVRGTDDDRFVPSISVTIGMALAIVDLGVLIYFIHHVAVSIQANQVIAVVSRELHESIVRLWPEDLGSDNDRNEYEPAIEAAREPVTVAAGSSGYVDAVDDPVLMQIAVERDLVITLLRRPGQFVVKGSPLANIAAGSDVDRELREQVNGVFTFSSHRTPFQDVEFAVDQLVEIAVRALSPGINDPFTAMTCVDRLGEGLCLLARRTVPAPHRYDSERRLRVIAQPADFASVVDAAFNQIRQYGRSSTAVLIRMLETLAVTANHTTRNGDREALARHAELLHRAAASGIPEDADRRDIEERYELVRAALNRPATAENDGD